MEGGVDPFDAAFGIGDDDAIGRVVGDEGEAGVGFRDGAEVVVGVAKFASADRDGLLQLGGLLLQTGGEEEARFVGLFAAEIDGDGVVGGEEGEEQAGHDHREDEQADAVALGNHPELDRENGETDQRRRHEREPEKEAPGQRAAGRRGNEDLDEFILGAGE